MPLTVVRYEVTDHIATITLNRPDRLNAIVRELADQLREAFREAQRDPDVRCVVLTGAGEGFCSGDDIQDFWGDEQVLDAALHELKQPRAGESRAELLLFDKPVVAAVNGVAFGIGFDLALMSDIRLASERATFGDLRIRWNAVADFTSFLRLPRLVGYSRAAELLFTGDTISAEEALDIGLVSRVLPPDELLPAAHAVAARIASQPPLAMRYMKEGLRRSTMSTALIEELTTYVNNSVVHLFATDDHREAVQAFREKRAPVFKGR